MHYNFFFAATVEFRKSIQLQTIVVIYTEGYSQQEEEKEKRPVTNETAIGNGYFKI